MDEQITGLPTLNGNWDLDMSLVHGNVTSICREQFYKIIFKLVYK